MTRQHLKDLASLTRRKGRQAHGRFLVEGVRSVASAVAAGAPLVEILVDAEVLDDPRVADLLEAVPHDVLSARDLARIGDTPSSQGVIAVSRSVVRPSLDVEGPVVVLDGVQDPGNVGALVRSAAWFGAAAVVTDTRSADLEGPKAVRAAMGGLWDLALVRTPDLPAILDARRAAGASVWGADLDGTTVSAWRPGAADVLVLGSEGHGLSPDIARRLTGRVSIPGGTARGVESLNVGVAAGVLLARWLGA